MPGPDFRRASEGPRATGTPSGRANGWRRPWITPLVVVVLSAFGSKAHSTSPSTAAADAIGAEESRETDSGLGFPRRPAPSPDGSEVAFCYQGDLWLVSSEGGEARRLTVHPAYDTDPIWSPDGRWIAFSSERDGNADVYVVSIAGGDVRRLTWHSDPDTPCGWTPDGRGILVNSARLTRDSGASGLFLVPLEGGVPVQLLPTGATDGAISPDGRRIAGVRNGEAWSRRGYEGSSRSRLWLYTPDDPEWLAKAARRERSGSVALAETPATSSGLGAAGALLAGGEHRPLNLPGEDVSQRQARPPRGGRDPERDPLDPSGEGGFTRDPHWLPGGDHLVYLAEHAGVANLKLLSLADGRRAFLTRFTDGRMRFPSIARDGSLAAFEYEDGIYTLRLPHPRPEAAEGEEIVAWDGPPSEPRRLEIRLPRDARRNDLERIKITGGAEEMALSPDGEQIAFVARGEVFVMKANKDEPFAQRITSTTARERDLAWAPDSKSLLFSSDRDGQSDLWQVSSADPGEPRLARALRFETTRLSTDPAEDRRPAFDPDGKRIAFVRGHRHLVTMASAGGGERILFTGQPDLDFRWSPDGKWIAVAAEDDDDNSDIWIVPADGSAQPRNVSLHPADDTAPFWSADGKLLAFVSQRRYLDQVDIWYLRLTREDDELSDVDRLDRLQRPESNGDGKDRTREKEKGDALVVRIDFDRIERRVRRLTSFPGSEAQVVVARDGGAFFFVSDTDGKRDLWRLKWNGTDPKRLTTGGASPTHVQLDAKGKTLWFLKSGGAISSVGADGGEVTSYPYEGQMELDRQAERAAVFDEAWRIVRDRFYDPALHGVDWDDVRVRYRPWALAASTQRDFQDVIRLMLGEINSSHQGIWGGPGDTPGDLAGANTGELGILCDPTHAGPGLRILQVIPETPADRVESRLEPGETILAIQDRPVGPGEDPAAALDQTVDRKVLLTVLGRDGKERLVPIRPTTPRAVRRALDRREMEAKRALVDARGQGRLAYLQIDGMDIESLEEFERELLAVARGRDVLLIDVRGNGGGWTTDLLLTSLTAPDHAICRSRDGGPGYPEDRRLLYAWTKPVVVLCDERSFSNAEIFAWAIKTLRRGPIVGQPTAGGVISTGAVTLLDGSVLRTPVRGWFTRYDGRNQEGNGCPPDVVVENHPDDLARGVDRQLQAAIEEGLKLLP